MCEAGVESKVADFLGCVMFGKMVGLCMVLGLSVSFSIASKEVTYCKVRESKTISTND